MAQHGPNMAPTWPQHGPNMAGFPEAIHSVHGDSYRDENTVKARYTGSKSNGNNKYRMDYLILQTSANNNAF